jgi:hypothetical protein
VTPINKPSLIASALLDAFDDFAPPMELQFGLGYAQPQPAASGSQDGGKSGTEVFHKLRVKLSLNPVKEASASSPKCFSFWITRVWKDAFFGRRRL